jgi:hypothetical protein
MKWSGRIARRRSKKRAPRDAGHEEDGGDGNAPRDPRILGAFHRGAGGGLLSRGLATGVPSALSGLTAVFGMGTGVAPTL